MTVSQGLWLRILALVMLRLRASGEVLTPDRGFTYKSKDHRATVRGKGEQGANVFKWHFVPRLPSHVYSGWAIQLVWHLSHVFGKSCTNLWIRSLF